MLLAVSPFKCLYNCIQRSNIFIGSVLHSFFCLLLRSENKRAGTCRTIRTTPQSKLFLAIFYVFAHTLIYCLYNLINIHTYKYCCRTNHTKCVISHKTLTHYPLSYRLPVRERYGSTLLPATREQQDQNCTQSH